MSFDYERETKGKYQSDAVASTYHRNYTKDYDLRGLRSRFIAAAERKAVAQLLARVPHKTVLDIPTGTGKLAPVFARFQSTVLACDISANMLEVARTEFARFGCASAEFKVQDAAELSALGRKRFDAAVCLRLLHRVPSEIRRKILSGLSEVAGHAVVSYGIDSAYHSIRRSIRSKLIGEGNGRFCACTLDEAKAEIGEHFRIKAQKWTVPVVSGEVVFLLEAKDRRA